MNDTVIKIEHLSKQYRLGLVGTGTLSHDLNRWWHVVRGKEDPYLKIGETNDRTTAGNSQYAWALRDINLEIERGEVLGIIGKNGAGKSTLLKILSRVTGPTTGRAKINGRIGSLLEVGTGFHPELTGKENIFLNGAILGMTKGEIKSKLDEIIEFSGTVRYIDTPVKRYSSGMKVRLAFAVAAHLDPEILVVDEVLAVGDSDFQKKALGKMNEISKNEGRTIVFVSHNMSAISNICSKVVLLRDGEINLEGNTDSVIKEYLKGASAEANLDIAAREDRGGNQQVIINKIELLDITKKSRLTEVICGEGILINVHYNATKNYLDDRIQELHIGLPVFDSNRKFVTVLNNKIQKETFKNIAKEGIITCLIPKLSLMFGKFYIDVHLAIDGNMSDSVEYAVELNVLEGDYYKSGFPNAQNRQGIYIEHDWLYKKSMSENNYQKGLDENK